MMFGLNRMKKVRPYVGSLMLIVLISLSFLFIIRPVSAAVMANITSTNPPSGVTVEPNSVFPLGVGVSYKPPPNNGDYYLWVIVDGKTSNQIKFTNPTSYMFQFSIKAPPTEGTYTLKISLYILTEADYMKNPTAGVLRDTATFTYHVKPKVVTDWDVEKIWHTPDSPGPDDEVTFHARIALRSTTSKNALSVDVMCFLDRKQFIQSPLVLTFQPSPSTQEVAVPRSWMATEGEHELMFSVDQLKRHNDPTAYPKYNFMSMRFLIEPYYAVIHDIKNPPEVDPGEAFEVVVGVEYKFPDSTQLRITNFLPSGSTGDEQLDTVSGEGIGTYTFSAVGPSVPHASPGGSGLVPFNASAQVEYDRGSGWQHTSSRWERYYIIYVRQPTYYAVFDSVEATYIGSASDPGYNGTLGRFSITMNVRYLLPLDTGLRLVVRGFNGTTEVLRVEETITQEDSVERTGTYTNEYTFPLASYRAGSYSVGFEASLDYMVEGSWHHGDDDWAMAFVSIIRPPEEPVSRTIIDDFIDRLDSFFEWMRRGFGMVTMPISLLNLCPKPE